MPDLRVVTTAEASGALLDEIRALLVHAFDGEFSDDDWEHTLGGWHVVLTDQDVVVSHAAVVLRVIHVGGRPLRAGYVEGVATAKDRRREGLGAAAMSRANSIVRREFELGVLSTGSPGFYGRLGWERWRGPTFVRHGSEEVRTEDEDDGVMVLRFGSTADVDLGAPIACEARSGDDW